MTAASIEEIGKYHPKEDPSLIEVDSERAQYWLGVGAQPTEPVAAILKVTGDWQKFKGEPAPGHPEGRRAEDRQEGGLRGGRQGVRGEPKAGATTPTQAGREEGRAAEAPRGADG